MTSSTLRLKAPTGYSWGYTNTLYGWHLVPVPAPDPQDRESLCGLTGLALHLIVRGQPSQLCPDCSRHYLARAATLAEEDRRMTLNPDRSTPS